MPHSVPPNLPLHTPLSDHPVSASDVEPLPTAMTKEALLACLPGYYEFKNRSCRLHKKYLTLINHEEENKEMKLNAHLLLSYQLVQPDTDPACFVTNVKVYDESQQVDVCCSNVHEKSVQLLCGEEGVSQLKSCRNISLEAWLLTGGGSEENGFQPVLHQIVKK